MPQIPSQPQSGARIGPETRAAATEPLPPLAAAPAPGQLLPGKVELAASLSVQGGAKAKLPFVGPPLEAAVKALAHTRDKIGDAVSHGLHALRGDVRLWHNPALGEPPARPELRIASYNIYMGRKDLAAVGRELSALRADVICLQEASWEASQQLAQELGMHLVFHEAESGLTRTVGKAILSKYPILETENKTYSCAWTGRLKSAVTAGKAEALEDRSLLRATLKVGSRKLEIVDTHLSLADPAANASQLQQLANYVIERRQTGAAVLVAGDFNTNFALSGGAQDAPGQVQTPTDTLAEYLDRYQRHPGNVADAEDAAAVRRLGSLLQPHWQAPERLVQTSTGLISPEEALKELPKLKTGSPRHKELLYVLDGISHGGAAKRFDNLLASRDLRLVSSRIDQTATGSDHWPVLLEVAWKDPD